MIEIASPLGLLVRLFIYVVYIRKHWSLSFSTSSAMLKQLRENGRASWPTPTSPQLEVIMKSSAGSFWHGDSWYPHIHLLICTVGQRSSQFDP